MEIETRGGKVCRCCKQEKDKTKFYRDPRNKDGYVGSCRACEIQRTSEWQKRHPSSYRAIWRKKNPEKDRATQRKCRYGLTDAVFKNLLSGQNNCCALCKKPFVKVPSVDHDHLTGKFRGLLCNSCNTGLGNLGDSVASLERALEYLKKSL